MTVGLYINEPLPIMLSDCLALPKDGRQKIYSPSTIEYFDGKSGKLSDLVSKFIFLDEKTIIALAGDTRDIFEFVREFPERWMNREKDISPMEFLRRIDKELRRVRPGWRCSVVGASIVSEGMSGHQVLVNNYASPNENWKFETENFGACFSVGSGSGRLREFIMDADRNVSTLKQKITIEKLHFLLGGLNGLALFMPFLNPLNESWGGLLQMNMYSPMEKRWVRTPPWFHVGAILEGRNYEFRGLHPKTVLHSSSANESHGSVVVASVLNDDGSVQNFRWRIDSPFVNVESGEQSREDEAIRAPLFTTITTFMDFNGRYWINHRTYPTEIVEGMIFEQSEGHLNWNFDFEKFGKWVQQRNLNDPELKILGL